MAAGPPPTGQRLTGDETVAEVLADGLPVTMKIAGLMLLPAGILAIIAYFLAREPDFDG